jgi:hypothetical protein
LRRVKAFSVAQPAAVLSKMHQTRAERGKTLRMAASLERYISEYSEVYILGEP